MLRCANESGMLVAPRGGGTKLSWGNPPARVDLIVSTVRLNRVVEHAWADLTVTVQSGCTIQNLQETLAHRGQRLALDALWPAQATIGGVLSTNDSGALRLRFGGLRDLIIGMTLALPDGTLARSGGKVVKNVAGYDLPKLATGALGTLGIITQAVFRVHPLPRNARTFSVGVPRFPEMQQFILALQDSRLAHISLQVRCGEGALPEVDVAFEGTEKGLEAQVTRLRMLAQPMLMHESGASVWAARERLCSSTRNETVVKISVPGAEIPKIIEAVKRMACGTGLHWSVVAQATGLGWLRLAGAVEAMHSLLRELRAILELRGGSLVVLRQPPDAAQLEAWGNSGDQRPLMLALKQQFDHKGTLNRGRFVGRI